MGIESNFNMSAMRKYADSKRDEFEEAALEAYKFACIEMVKRAKQGKEYITQTGALISSTGYVLYHNGIEVSTLFESNGGDNGGIGVQKGLAAARAVADQYKDKTFVAVVVAGMDYALYVESKGKDVLTGSTRGFAADLKEGIDDVKNALASNIKEHFGI